MENITGVSLELGGKSPAIVFEDTIDIAATAKGVAAGIFRNQGQVCVAGSRVYIQKKVFDKVLTEISHAAEKMKMSNGFDETADLGPLVSKGHLNKVCSYIDKGINEGASLVSGGKTPMDKGYFLQPTIFSATDNQHTIIQEEIFGPVLTAIPFTDMEDALAKSNDHLLGLAATVWTKDISKANRVAEKINAGIVWINCWMVRDLRTPFGGVKSSGVGREGGLEAMRFFTEQKNVCIKYG